MSTRKKSAAKSNDKNTPKEGVKKQTSKISDASGPVKSNKPPSENKSRYDEEEVNLKQEAMSEVEHDPDIQDGEPSVIGEKVTKETKGEHLADIEVNKSFAATEKIENNEEEKFYDQNDQQEAYTDVDAAREEMAQRQQEEEEIGGGIFDDLDIQPKKAIFNQETVRLVQESWQAVEAIGVEKVGIVLFKNIFKIAPEALQMFSFRDVPNLYNSPQLKKHGTTVIVTVGTAVAGLNNIESLIPVLQDLGFTHAKVGIKPEHYAVVGKALQNTLKAGLKKSYTSEIRRAWDMVYGIVTQTMIGNLYDNPDILSDDLTDYKIHLVQSSWNMVLENGVDVVGTIIFKNLFDLDENLLRLFPFGNEPEYESHPIFQEHIAKVVNTVNKAVENLDNLQSLVPILINMGNKHIGFRVKKADYVTLGRAILASLEQALGNHWSFELKRAWTIVWSTLQKAMIHDNYEQQDKTRKLIESCSIDENQKILVLRSWNKFVGFGKEAAGTLLFKIIFEISPELQQMFSFSDEKNIMQSKIVRSHAKKVIEHLETCIGLIDEVDLLYEECETIRQKHEGLEIGPIHHIIIREALFEAMEKTLGEYFTMEHKTAWFNVYNMFRNLIMGQDVDKMPLTSTVLNIYEIRVLQRNWNQLKTRNNIYEDVGPATFKILFEKYPEALEYFPFKNQKNFLGSAIVKKQAAGVINNLGKGVEVIDDFDKISNIFKALGKEHIGRNIGPAQYNVVADAFLTVMYQFMQNHYDNYLKHLWTVAYTIMTTKMMKGDSYNHTANTITKEELMSHKSKREALQGDNENKQNDAEEVEKFYVEHYAKEVDFHHKVAYRFEKAYRLGKKSIYRKQTLNLEIIDCISEHSAYIEHAPMSLFYCLFFCVYYKNDDLVEFIRTLIEKVPPIEKIDKLLEAIDLHGLDKIRTIGEQINQLVYHQVFYQAVDDDLRIVYSSIMRQSRFLQMRDKDALHLLKKRDYELIRMSFDRYVAKLDIKEFMKKEKTVSLKCHSYRKYNQAYYEEIVINNDVESRVAQNYREKFLVTADDIYIVFEMYCKEDYDEQFIKTKKNEITHKQFVDLFIVCLKNDAFKIAILIYSLYLDPVKDMDEKMMDILMSTLKDSVKFHEAKLFYLHEHFDVLSIQQMNQLVDIYQEILNRKDVKENPIISQFNTIKVSLLIYRISWKIEQKQIYSLITKCSLLQTYLINSLKLYFEKQNNILTLYKFMIEPILHMTERKDSLDIMYEMNMQSLLQHPVVIEVLNLVYEGKYSVSSSALSMSQTFQCLLDMNSLSLKNITDRLISNIVNFGNLGSSKQTSLQYNIWKQSIQQREQDEMFFTTLINAVMIIISIIVNQNFNSVYYLQISAFNKLVLTGDFSDLKAASPEVGRSFCSELLPMRLSTFNSITAFYYLMILNTVGMISSTVQKMTIYRIKNNVTLNFTQLAIEISISACGILYILIYNSTNFQPTISKACGKFVKLTEEEIFYMDKVQMFAVAPEGELSFKYVISVIVFLLCLISIMMLQRTEHLGELIIMFKYMTNELLRFFSTFGLLIIAFLMVGRMISYEIQDINASYWVVFMDLFNAFNGNPNFIKFTMPIGQVYIGVFMFIFKILLMSLLAAMFINKYKIVWANLSAFKRFEIIKQKNSVTYDRFFGGVTITFFPINVIILPFILPIIYFKSKRASDFLLKLQYSILVVMYTSLACILVCVISPFLYIKILVNCFYIMFNNKREAYKGENIVQLIMGMLVSPILIVLSILVDIFSIPNLLFKDSKDFEHKYQQSQDRLNDAQIDVVMTTFGKIFYNGNFTVWKGKNMTLIQLMVMHTRIFSITKNLHDLTCRGNKNHTEALSKVQDYNMTKIITRQASIPDLNGDYKESKVELNILYAIQFDIENYNYIDIVLRKLRMGILAKEMEFMSNKKGNEDENKAAEEAPLADEDEDDDETKKVDGILAIGIGPDGVPLKRNNSDVMNNFFVNAVVRSFTDCENILKNINQNEKRRQARFEEEIAKKEKVWQAQTVEKFKECVGQYENFVKVTYTKEGKKHEKMTELDRSQSTGSGSNKHPDISQNYSKDYKSMKNDKLLSSKIKQKTMN